MMLVRAIATKSRGPRTRGGRIRESRHSQTSMTTLAQAQSILAHDLLGTDEVARRLGIRFTAEQKAHLEEIPFPERVLVEAGGTHILIASAPVSLLDLRAGPAGHLLYPNRNAWYEKLKFAGERADVR